MSADEGTVSVSGGFEAAVRGLRVLVVEGSEQDRCGLGALLHALGMEPTLMAQVSPAIDELRRADHAGRPYGLLVFDAALRGSVVLRARRADDDPLLAATPRVELVGGAARAETFAGGGVRLGRPVTRRTLLEALARLFPGAPRAAAHADGPRATGPGPRVLLVALDPVTALVMSRLVELAGFQTVIAASGQADLESAATVDVVILDPAAADAAALVRQLRLMRPELRVLGLGAASPAQGAGDELALDGTVDMTLDRDQLRRHLCAPRGGQAPAAQLYDAAALAGRLGNDDGAARRVLSRFVEQAPVQLEALDQALSAADAAVVGRLAHRLRGALLWIGAEGAAALAADLEALCHAGDVAQAARVGQALMQATRRVAGAIVAAGESSRA